MRAAYHSRPGSRRRSGAPPGRSALTSLLLAGLLTFASGCKPSGPDSVVKGGTSPSASPSLLPSAAPSLPLGTPAPGSQVEWQAYGVGRKVRDFPEAPDLSRPERTVAGLWRAHVQGASTRPFVLKSLPAAPAGPPLPPAYARSWLNQEILEVQVQGGTRAAVYLWNPDLWGAYFDVRFLERHNGQWLCAGNKQPPAMPLARACFTNWCHYREQEAARRAPVQDPAGHLAPFVSFLRTAGEEPQAYVLKALAEHKLVIMGEVHHRPQYWAFNRSLVEAPAFARHVGALYLELPSGDQPLVDQFLASPRLDPQPIITVLRDMLWTGWPDQPTLDCFISVWKVNRALPPEQKVRIVLVDPRPLWKDVHDRDDAQRGELRRDHQMANAILRDLRAHRHDPRHGLFIVGMLHAVLDVTSYELAPLESAGRVLRRKLGPEAVFAIHSHRPVRFGLSAGLQRPALGLFDSAFAALQCRPVAFPLEQGPFGSVVLDDFLDQPLYSCSRYRDGFSAYLYLGPLEEEMFSPLIPGFYTDEFVQELDRRHRVLSGKGLVEGAGLARLDGASFTAWMGQSWGKPRAEWSAARLGPVTRWQEGLPEADAEP